MDHSTRRPTSSFDALHTAVAPVGDATSAGKELYSSWEEKARAHTVKRCSARKDAEVDEDPYSVKDGPVREAAGRGVSSVSIELAVVL